jgi:hypothetical protein
VILEESAALAALRRWEDSGALWRVVYRRPGGITVGLYECTGGTEVGRIDSDDPDLLRYIGNRSAGDV